MISVLLGPGMTVLITGSEGSFSVLMFKYYIKEALKIMGQHVDCLHLKAC